MVKAQTPELKKYMDKHLMLQLNGNRKLTGILRGFDPFLNLVLDKAEEIVPDSQEKRELGMIVIRGNSVVMMEALERIQQA